MTALYNGFALKHVEQVYNKVLNLSIEVLSEYIINSLLETPLNHD